VVVEARDGLCLTREARLGDRVLRQVRAQQLHRDRTAQTQVLGGEDLRHAAPAETVREAVTAVADDSVVAPQLRRFGHGAAHGVGVGGTPAALRLCHLSSPWIEKPSCRGSRGAYPLTPASCPDAPGRPPAAPLWRLQARGSRMDGDGSAIQSAAVPGWQVRRRRT
jgi:hypothetical protein